jgi:hypothetical protein
LRKSATIVRKYITAAMVAKALGDV